MPPEQRPRREVSLRRVGLLGRLASVLIAAVALASAFYSWTSWNTLGVLEDIFARPYDFTEDQVASRAEAADNLTLIAAWLYGLFTVAAAIVFIIWLWRARQNSEALSEGLHTRARGWAIGGWFVPIVAWWFPYQVVRDVWLASDPATRIVTGELRRTSGGKLVGWWWACWIVASVTALISLRHAQGEPSAETIADIERWFRLGATYDTVSTVFEVLAVVLVFFVIRRISAWQDAPAPAAEPASEAAAQ